MLEAYEVLPFPDFKACDAFLESQGATIAALSPIDRAMARAFMLHAYTQGYLTAREEVREHVRKMVQREVA